MVYYGIRFIYYKGQYGGKWYMAYKRTIKFSYYTVCSVNEKEGTDPKRFDFEAWIEKAEKLIVEQKEIEFDGTIARLECLEGDSANHIWKIRFLKLRDTNIPSIVKKEEEAKPLELEDDEYIGEDLVMIYDPKNQVAMIQSNRFAFSKGKLEKYLNKIWGVDEQKIVLLHISKKIDVAKIKGKQSRSLILRLANVHPIEETDRPLSKIINAYATMGGKAGNVAFTLGRGSGKKAGLDGVQVPIMLDDIYDNQDIVDDAILKIRDDDTNSIDIVDLFDFSLHEYIEYKLEKRTTLEFDYATRQMIEKYKDRKPEIDKLLK